MHLKVETLISLKYFPYFEKYRLQYILYMLHSEKFNQSCIFFVIYSILLQLAPTQTMYLYRMLIIELEFVLCRRNLMFMSPNNNGVKFIEIIYIVPNICCVFQVYLWNNELKIYLIYLCNNVLFINHSGKPA